MSVARSALRRYFFGLKDDAQCSEVNDQFAIENDECHWQLPAVIMVHDIEDVKDIIIIKFYYSH